MNNNLPKILLVESDTKVSSELMKILENNQYKCLHVHSVKQAIKLIELDPSIDLIISSMFTPQNGCLELLKNVSQSQRFHYIPIILTTSACDQDIIIRAIKLGAKDIIIKPFDEKPLLAKVEKAIADGRRRILIVDDEPEILKLLKYVMELERFKVSTAATAEQALEIMKDIKAHVVVSDILLPGMSGFELLMAIKDTYKGIPVVLMTGYSGQFTPQSALEAGADGYFTKPFSNVDLIRKLREVLEAGYHLYSMQKSPD